MINKKEKIYSNCEICNQKNFSFFVNLINLRVPDRNFPISICKNCGFVTIWPKPNFKDYKEINALWYKVKFSLKRPGINNESIFKRWEIMWGRVGRFIKDNQNLDFLDVGSGQGLSIQFLKSKIKNLNATAIEQWPDCQKHIKEKLNSKVVDVDIDGIWPESLHGKFDFIILRHTLEHLMNPTQTLTQIEKCLKPNGLAYIVVPNLITNKFNRNLRTDFFRPVHLHYFTIEHFEYIVNRCKMTPITLNNEDEIWGLFKKGFKEMNIQNHHNQNLNYLNKWKKKVFFSDYKMISKIYLKKIFNNYFKKNEI
jgi:2-polyprenyl-3-methyl-5-hydroxy-6-metoxy-1,4-benzoquinol methylase